jgi:hypothetical protein
MGAVGLGSEGAVGERAFVEHSLQHRVRDDPCRAHASE